MGILNHDSTSGQHCFKNFITINAYLFRPRPTSDSNMLKNLSQLVKDRFIILATLLFGLMFLITIRGQWAGDSWEHSAVVRELATNIFNPHHPQLLLNTPHAFF
jgi:hypothetical protein